VAFKMSRVDAGHHLVSLVSGGSGEAEAQSGRLTYPRTLRSGFPDSDERSSAAHLGSSRETPPETELGGRASGSFRQWCQRGGAAHRRSSPSSATISSRSDNISGVIVGTQDQHRTQGSGAPLSAWSVLASCQAGDREHAVGRRNAGPIPPLRKAYCSRSPAHAVSAAARSANAQCRWT
jgi:hypothetical protein